MCVWGSVSALALAQPVHNTTYNNNNTTVEGHHTHTNTGITADLDSVDILYYCCLLQLLLMMMIMMRFTTLTSRVWFFVCRFVIGANTQPNAAHQIDSCVAQLELPANARIYRV